MRYPASEKAEIIRLVEASHLSARRTLDKLGIPRATFYRWYDRYLTGGVEALADHRSRPDRVWNRIPDPIRAEIVDLALRETDLSPRELAVRFTDEKSYFVSEASVYRLLRVSTGTEVSPDVGFQNSLPGRVLVSGISRLRDRSGAFLAGGRGVWGPAAA